jgi:DNA polymerase-3 subunit delta
MERPGFTFLACPDPEIIRERVDRLLADTKTAFAKEVFWGDEEIGASYWNALTVPSLLGGRRAVVLRRAEACPPEFWSALAPALRGFNDAVWPFFCLEGPFDRKGPKLPKGLADQPFYKVAVKRKWVFTSPGLTRRDMGPRLADWAAGRGLALGPGVAEGLAAALPPDLARADNELAKLRTGLGDRTEIECPTSPCSPTTRAWTASPSWTPFPAGEIRRRSGAKFSTRSCRGGNGLSVLGLLLYEARTMWRRAAGEGSDIRLPPYVLEKKQAMARRLGAAGLARIFEAAFTAEAGIKSGARRPDQAMERLTAELFRILGGPTGSRERFRP